MVSRNWLFAVVAAMLVFATGLSAPLKTIQGHVLTFDIRVAGEQVMAPTVALFANAPATIEMRREALDQRYVLELLLKEQQRVGKVDDAISIDAQLQSGSGDAQELLASSTLFIRPGTGGAVTTGSPQGEVTVNVITHATKSHAAPEDKN